MIVAERKPFNEIKEMISGKNNILIIGCGTCVTINQTGGEKEVAILASELRIAKKLDGESPNVEELTIQRQCEREFVEEISQNIEQADVVLSMACGVGVQTMAEIYPDKLIFPVLNTISMAFPDEPGHFKEMCSGCGNCVLHEYGGICPITRCSKSMLNGPCGGSKDGKCEINPDIECAWQLIIDKLKKQGRLDILTKIKPAKDWSSSHHGGPRTLIIEEAEI